MVDFDYRAHAMKNDKTRPKFQDVKFMREDERARLEELVAQGEKAEKILAKTGEYADTLDNFSKALARKKHSEADMSTCMKLAKAMGVGASPSITRPNAEESLKQDVHVGKAAAERLQALNNIKASRPRAHSAPPSMTPVNVQMQHRQRSNSAPPNSACAADDHRARTTATGSISSAVKANQGFIATAIAFISKVVSNFFTSSYAKATEAKNEVKNESPRPSARLNR